MKLLCMSTGIGMTMAITITCSRERRAPPTTAIGTNIKQRPILIHTGLTLIIDTIIMTTADCSFGNADLGARLAEFLLPAAFCRLSSVF